jgi:hypothetical protein
MLNNHRQVALLGLWTGLIAIIVAASVTMGANLSTTAFLLALSAAPIIVMAMLASHAPASSVAEILYAVTKDGRR